MLIQLWGYTSGLIKKALIREKTMRFSNERKYHLIEAEAGVISSNNLSVNCFIISVIRRTEMYAYTYFDGRINDIIGRHFR